MAVAASRTDPGRDLVEGARDGARAGEAVRPADFGLSMDQVAARITPAVEALIAENDAKNRARLIELMREHQGVSVGDPSLDDTLDAVPGVHRAEHRLRPRVAQNPRRARRQCLSRLRQQDLDHPSGARRLDDAL